MNLKRLRLKRCRLYLVLDKDTAGKRDLIRIAQEAIAGGVDCVQLRCKASNAREILVLGAVLRRITKSYKVLFIVNDRLDLAIALNADGAHLGHEDIPIGQARYMLGKDRIIGLSTHSATQAKQAQAAGADYISVGPIFKTPTKKEYAPVGLDIIKNARENIEIPFFAIGGINLDNIQDVIAAGASRIAVVRSIATARDPKKAALSLREKLL